MEDSAAQSRVIYLTPLRTRVAELRGVFPYPLEGVANIKDLIFYFLTHSDALGIIAELQSDPVAGRRLLELARRINPQLPVIFLGERALFDRIAQPEGGLRAEHAANFDELAEHFKPGENRRRYFRLEWPMSVLYATRRDLNGTQTGKLVNLSAGGASIYTLEPTKLVLGQEVYLKILFDFFAFSVEAKVVRLGGAATPGLPAGFAVSFHNITPATERCIRDLLSDHLVKGLLAEFEFPYEAQPPKG